MSASVSAPRFHALASLLAIVLALGALGTRSVAAEESTRDVAWVSAAGESLLDRYAPVFVTEHSDESWNRVGTPSARIAENSEEEIYVDPDTPTIYRRKVEFEADDQHYTNLIYRVHFERSPFTWLPLNVGTGRNVGLMLVVTLDSSERPLWVTTVQTCGCYHAIIPTTHLPRAAWPEDWDPDGIVVYGEHLPGLLPWPETRENLRLVASVREGTHRVMDLTLMSRAAVAERYEVVSAASRPISDLDALPVAGGTTSFFHESGRKRGLVKGAWKPMETLLFGLWIRDFHVGRDRRYGPRDETELFYTTLNPIRKNRSDMWEFAEFLQLDGWKTGVVLPRHAEPEIGRSAGARLEPSRF